MAKCNRCKERGKTWQGSDPTCAFDNEEELFQENWNCATMSELRQAAENKTVWSEDTNAALLPWDGEFIVLKWYKSRGATECAFMLEGTEARPLSLDEAEQYLAFSTSKVVSGGKDE